MLACYASACKVGVLVRALIAILLSLLVAQCATRQERPSESAVVILGVAETSTNRDPAYSMLWRLLDAGGRFTDYDDTRALDARTNARGTIRVRGIPGEFAIVELTPGVYALDGVFAALRENGLSYFAQGVIEGPDRPAFEVRRGEAVYLGIWELDVDGAEAKARLWRLDAADLSAVVRATRRDLGEVRLRETQTRAVACRPHRINEMTQRRIC